MHSQSLFRSIGSRIGKHNVHFLMTSAWRVGSVLCIVLCSNSCEGIASSRVFAFRLATQFAGACCTSLRLMSLIPISLFST